MSSSLRLFMFIGCAFLSSALVAPAHAATPVKTKEQEEREKRERAMFGNLGKLAPSQQQIGQAAAFGSRNAANLSRAAGNRSIFNGVRHIRHGRMHLNRPEIRLGYFEVVQGVLGLFAARTASTISSKDEANAKGLQNLTGIASQGPDGAMGAPAGEHSSSSSGGNGGSSDTTGASAWSEVRAELARDEEAKIAFAEIEDEYGIKKEDLLAELEAGKDGRALIVDAEKNHETPEDATASLKEFRAGLSADGLALAGGAAASAPAASITSAPAAADMPLAATGKSQGNKKSTLRERLSRDLASLDDVVPADEVEVSAEVREALEAKESEEAKLRERMSRAGLEPTIFDMVRGKYKEREGQIRGWIKSPVYEARME